MREQTLERVQAIIESQARSFGCNSKVEHRPAYPVLVNHAAETEFARQVGVELVGADAVDGNTPKLMGSEDFAWMLQRCPGAYLFIGNGVSRPMVHNPAYDFNDDILLTGAAYWGALTGAGSSRPDFLSFYCRWTGRAPSCPPSPNRFLESAPCRLRAQVYRGPGR